MRILKLARSCALMTSILVLAAGCASGPPSYQQNVMSAVGGNGFVRAHVQGDGTVIVSGWVEDYYSRQAVITAARQGEGITRVISRIYIRK